MKGNVKIYAFLLIGIVLLIIAIFVREFTRTPVYKLDNTPGDVAHNYLVALHYKDYARGYGYLSRSIKNRIGSVENFKNDVENKCKCLIDSFTMRIRPIDISASEVMATIEYVGSFRPRGLSGSTFIMKLQYEDNTWKISSSELYWAECWNKTRGCSE